MSVQMRHGGGRTSLLEVEPQAVMIDLARGQARRVGQAKDGDTGGRKTQLFRKQRNDARPFRVWTDQYEDLIVIAVTTADMPARAILSSTPARSIIRPTILTVRPR